MDKKTFRALDRTKEYFFKVRERAGKGGYRTLDIAKLEYFFKDGAVCKRLKITNDGYTAIWRGTYPCELLDLCEDGEKIWNETYHAVL